MIEFEQFFAKSTRGAERSIIRELLKMAGGKVISFAGGLPDPATFPVEEIRQVLLDVLNTNASRALQYGTTEGDVRLRDELVKWMAKDGITGFTRDDILVTSGSQQALDMVGRILLDPGDALVCELPSYLGGLQAFRAYQVHMVGVRQDDEGVQPDRLAKALGELRRAGRPVKFIYVVPDFQNPSGITWTRERRERLLEVAAQFNTLIVEDNPYREMRFMGQAPPPVAALDPDQRTMYLSTFSKTLAPGLRIGWIAAPRAIIERCVTAKQGMDLCGPALTQAVAAALLAGGTLQQRLPNVVALYRRKREVMIETLQREMPPGVSWTRPEGGLFLWVRLPEEMDAGEMLKAAMEEEGIAYVPGQSFHCDGSGRNTIRLNFSYPSEHDIQEGITRLARLVRRRAAPAIHTIHRGGTTVSD